MKISIKKLFVLLAVVMSFVAIQAVWAGKGPGMVCDVPVEGTIAVDGIDYDNNAITVCNNSADCVTVYGIPLAYLTYKLKIELKVGDNVEIKAHECPSTGKLMACELNDIDLRKPKGAGNQGVLVPAGTSALSTTTTAATDCTCDNCHYDCIGDCPNCTCEILCDCTCDGTGPNGPKK
jgi:hypothetical protein